MRRSRRSSPSSSPPRSRSLCFGKRVPCGKTLRCRISGLASSSHAAARDFALRLRCCARQAAKRVGKKRHRFGGDLVSVCDRSTLVDHLRSIIERVFSTRADKLGACPLSLAASTNSNAPWHGSAEGSPPSRLRQRYVEHVHEDDISHDACRKRRDNRESHVVERLVLGQIE